MPFKKGQSGNPKGGVEKEWTWGSLLKEHMNTIGEGDKKYAKHLVAEAIAKKAKEGDTQAFREIANRMDGMPKQQTDITSGGKEIQPLLVKFIDGEEK